MTKIASSIAAGAIGLFVLLQAGAADAQAARTWVSSTGSDLRVQIQLDGRYQPFIARATEREILGERLPVAAVQDVLQGKVWAALDPERRASKRQKDLADISRLIEHHPELRSHVPQEILDRLVV